MAELLPYLRENLAEGWRVRSVQVEVVSDGAVPPQWLAPSDWNYWVRLMRALPEEMQADETRAAREGRARND